MSERSDTWMPFYVGDYLGATNRLTTEQHGAYLLLILDYWKNGPPPNDDAVLAQIVRLSPQAWRKAKPALIGFFHVEEGQLIQRRIERERKRAAEITEKRSKAGKKSAEVRAKAKPKGGNRSTDDATHDGTLVPANEQQNGRPSQSPSSEDKSSGDAVADPVKNLFDVGVSVLTSTGLSEAKARSMVGKWRKQAKDDGKVLSALLDCRAKTISNPVEWLEKRFAKAPKWVSPSGYEYHGSDADVLRESERRNDMTTYWAVKGAMAK